MRLIASLAAVLVAAAVGSAVALAGGAAGSSSSLPRISIAMDGKSISVGGDLQSGAVDIHSVVSKAPGASPTLVHLRDGVGEQQFMTVLKRSGSDVDAVSTVGEIVFGGGVLRGASDMQTVLPAGNYVALDTSKQNPPFPMTTFTVKQAAAPAVLPRAAATVHAIEYGFRGASVLRNGTIVRTVNDGWLVHMAHAVGVRNAAQGHRVIDLLRAGKDRQAERLITRSFIPLAGVVSHGAVQQAVLHAKPGYYVLVCFMDTQDGREHTQLGMVRLIRVIG